MADENRENDPSNDALNELYYEPGNPGSYGGVERLYQAAVAKGIRGITREKVEKYLKSQQSYSVHRPARKHFPRNKTIVSGIDAQWQADLADMQSIAKENDNAHYILTVIDVFSKYAWAVPVKNKGSAEMCRAFTDLLKIADPRKPGRLHTDAGKEFLNKDLQALLKKEGIHHFVTGSDQKAALVERFNRTLKSRIWTYFTAHQTHRYIDILHELVEAYNHSRHRSIGCTPAEVQRKDEDRLWVKLYGDGGRSRKGKLPPGQMVRVSKVKGVFEKGYLPNWTAEHFVVDKALRLGRRGAYKLKDYNNEEMTGEWYPEEVQAIDNNRYLIEKVLKRRNGAGGIKEIFVKWQGWSPKFNSWIPETNIEEIVKSKRTRKDG